MSLCIGANANTFVLSTSVPHDQDLDDTLDALIEAAARYDRRQLGPAGLKAWEVILWQRIRE